MGFAEEVGSEPDSYAGLEGEPHRALSGGLDLGELGQACLRESPLSTELGDLLVDDEGGDQEGAVVGHDGGGALVEQVAVLDGANPGLARRLHRPSP